MFCVVYILYSIRGWTAKTEENTLCESPVMGLTAHVHEEGAIQVHGNLVHVHEIYMSY